MNMTRIDIPQEQWGAMIGAAVMASITNDNRDKLIRDAVTALLTPSGSSWDNKKSPLQIAFEQAVNAQARLIVDAELNGNQEIQSRVRAILAEALDKALTGDNREKLVNRMAEALIEGFNIDRY
jgi:hypothetical protein